MKLLYITNGINGSGGLERVLSIKASYLVEQYGYDVSIICLNGGGEKPFYSFSDKIKIYCIPVKGNFIQYVFQYIKGLQRIVREIKPDVISVCDDGLKGFFVPRILGVRIPILYERHVSKLIELPLNANCILKLKTRLKWFLMNYLAANFDAFVILTEGNRKEWEHLKNLHVISNPNTFDSDLKADLSNKKVICVGKISIQKGQDMLAQVWEQVVKEFPDWELHNYGKFDASILCQENLPTNMFLHPPVKEIASKYLDSSIYVLPSRYEGFGMVLIEAMSFGIPCVAFNCNYGPSDIISNGVDGILVETGNINDLAQKIIFLIGNQGARFSMGSKALENVQRFLPESIMEQWDELFNSLKG